MKKFILVILCISSLFLTGCEQPREGINVEISCDYYFKKRDLIIEIKYQIKENEKVSLKSIMDYVGQQQSIKKKQEEIYLSCDK